MPTHTVNTKTTYPRTVCALSPLDDKVIHEMHEATEMYTYKVTPSPVKIKTLIVAFQMLQFRSSFT